MDSWFVSPIVGPISIHVRRLNGRTVTFFGDYHRPTPETPNGLSYHLAKILTSSKSQVLVETPCVVLTPEMLPSVGDELAEIDRVWTRHWEELNIGDRYQNLEFRRSPDPKFNLLRFFEWNPSVGSEFMARLKIVPDILSAMMNRDLITTTKLFQDLYQDNVNLEFSGYDRFGAQFENLHRREQIIGMVVARMTTIVSEIDLSRIETWTPGLIRISDCFNDAYAIGRILREVYFGTDDYLWIYAGYAHTYYIQLWLSEIYAAEIILDKITPNLETPLILSDIERNLILGK